MSSKSGNHLTLGVEEARRLAITRQQLAGERPPSSLDGLMQVMRAIRCLQLDPISAVARSPLLVLWSRMGRYDPDLLQRALWRDRRLFEYWAHAASIVLVDDLPIHRWHMMQRANGGWKPRTRRWLDENEALRRRIIDRLEEEGPLAPADFENDAVAAEWHSGGWTSARSVNQMLHCLWVEGNVLVAGRRGRTRLWDLAYRCLPPDASEEVMTQEQAVDAAVQRALRALGVGTARHIAQHFVRGRYPGLRHAIERLVRKGLIQPVQIVERTDRWPGEWYMHSEDASLLEQLRNGAWQPRTTLLSPFDNLICDRDRTELLFGFTYRVEIYVPAAKRQYGYYVLPILHGDRLVGRIDPRFDRQNEQLHINAVYAEGHATRDTSAGLATAGAVQELAHFLGARDIIYHESLPDAWRAAFDA